LVHQGKNLTFKNFRFVPKAEILHFKKFAWSPKAEIEQHEGPSEVLIETKM
jgi:hypothetical protein